MKSANWISAMGSIPCTAIPMATPTIEDSASGVSITRSSPNSSRNPAVTRKTPPRAPTSSPRTTTRSSAFISSHRVSWMVWTTFFSVMWLRLVRGRFGRGGLAARALHRVVHRPIAVRLRVSRVRLSGGEKVHHRRLGVGVRGAPRFVDLAIDLRLQLGPDRLDRLVIQEAQRLEMGAELEDGV